jgi:carboxyl-terminal processing protease
MNRLATLGKIGVGVFLVLFGILAGVALDRLLLDTGPVTASPDSNLNQLYSLLDEARQTIDQEYVDREAIDDTALTYGAIGGMVDALGDTGHSRFLSPEMLERQHTQTSGSFEGIGAYVESRNGLTIIVAPIDNSPAQAAGLQPGDAIIEVNGEDVTAMDLQDVISLILGPAGTQVTLTIMSPDTGELREVTITRARVELQNVTWATVPGTTIGHVRISSFSQNVTDDLVSALEEMQALELTGAILDLRSNPGGLLEEAIGVTSQFISEGDVLLRQNAEGEIQNVPARSGGVALDLPLVVLIDQGSASASEIVSGALQDAGRAVLVGETTFGTGTVLNEFGLSDGSALLLATEQWLTPNGRLIWHQGIEPDFLVELEPGTIPLFPTGLRELSADEVSGSEDLQLLKALELLS